MARLSAHLTAICLPIDPDSLAEDLAINDSTDTLASSYTEAGPRPGVSVPTDDRSRLVPVISGQQGEDLEVVVLGAGLPQLAQLGAVQVGWREAGQANSRIRGWTGPNFLTGWSPAVWSSETHTSAACTIPTVQQVAVAYGASTGGDRSRYVRVYDPQTATWGTAVAVRSQSDETDAIVCTPTGRLLCLADNRAYRSDDYGVTWDLHSTGVFPDDLPAGTYADYEGGRAAYGADGSIVWVGIETGTSTILQCASDDQLGTLVEVVAAATTGTSPTVAALPGGGFVIAYVAQGTSYPRVRRIASAWQALDEADAITVAATASSSAAISVDPDGLLWLHYTPTSSGTIEVATSVDGGATWIAYDEGALKSLSTADQQVVSYSATTASGAVYLVGGWVSSTASSTQASVGLVQLGGWSTLPLAIPGWSTARDWTSRSGSGPSTGSGSNATWIATEKPGDNGWTASGAGTDSLTSGYLTVTTSASQRYFYRATGTGQLPAVCVFEAKVVSGGSLIANAIACSRWISWVGHEYRIGVRFTTTAMLVIDGLSSVVATVSLDTTVDRQVLMLCDSTGTSGVWYKLASSTVWIEAWTGTLTDNTSTPTGTGGCAFGHAGLGTSESKWRWLADASTAVVGQGLGTTPAVGRPLSSLPIPLPHETGVTGYGPAWIAANAGPGALGEQYDVDADHDYPVEHAIPTVSPSPAEQWRTVARTEQVLAWDLGDRQWIGDSVILPLLRVNFRFAYLEYHDGSAWVSLGATDLATGFSGLDATLVGSTLVPASGTTAGARYVQEGELAGGHVVFDTGNEARTIVWNSAGSWTGTNTTPQIRIQLSGIDGTEDVTGGVHLVWPSGIGMYHLPTAALARRRWRVRIGATQATPESDYRAGWCVPYAVRILGAAPDWGWSRERTPAVDLRRSRRGTSRARRLGPAPRTWTLGWPSGTTVLQLRGTSEPDYLGHADAVSGTGTAAEDVAWMLDGLLELSRSGEVPVVALATVPGDGETLTDPTLWIAGRLTSSVRQDHMTGSEGTDEVLRVADIVIEEIV